jgi:hypothetical protein
VQVAVVVAIIGAIGTIVGPAVAASITARVKDKTAAVLQEEVDQLRPSHTSLTQTTSLPANSSLLTAGIIRASEFHSISWTDFFSVEPAPVHICFTVGHTWSVQNARLALRYAAVGNQPIRVTIADDEAKNGSLEYLQWQWDLSRDETRTKVNRSMNDWKTAIDQVRREGLNPLLSMDRICGIFPTTFYRVGSEVWLVLASRGRTKSDTVPAIRCKETGDPRWGLFDWIVSDFRQAETDGLVTRSITL